MRKQIIAAQSDQNRHADIIGTTDLTVVDNAMTHVVMIYVGIEDLAHSHYQEIHVDVKKNNSKLTKKLKKVQDTVLGFLNL